MSKKKGDLNNVDKLANAILFKLDSSVERQYDSVYKEHKGNDDIIDRKIQEIENNADETLLYIAEMCKDIYNTEVERENSILQQASNMQSAFSFVTAGLFVIAQIVSDHRGPKLTPFAILLGFGFITILLLLSLWFATCAQKRYYRKGAPTIDHLLDMINTNSHVEAIQNSKTRHIFTIQQYGAYYKDLKKVNEKRIIWIKISMLLFKAALVSGLFTAIILSRLDGL